MTAPKQGPRTRGPLAPARPRLERLEARDVPAVIVGTLDPSFGTGGKISVSRGFQTVNAEATDALGRVVVVGDAAGAGGGDILIARFNKDGTPDQTFNNGGAIALDFGGAFDTATAVAIDPAGNITVVGTSRPTGTNAGSITADAVRLTPTGSLASGFGPTGNGTETVPSPTKDTGLNAVALDAAGNVVVAGSGFDNPGLAYFVAGRLNPTTGAIDPAFNKGALQKIPIHPLSDDSANAVAVDTKGNIVLAGTSNINGTIEAAVVRLLPNGLLDVFGTQGIFTFNAPGSTSDIVHGVDTDAANNIYVALDTGPSAKMAVARVTSAGSLDAATFANGGFFVTPLGGVSGNPATAGVIVTPSGRVVLAGTVASGGPTGLDFAVVQLQPDGTLDTGFNGQSMTPGTALIDFAGHDDVARGLSRTPDGKLVVAGVDLNTNNLDVARLFGLLGIGRDVIASGTTDGNALLFPPAATNPGFLDGFGRIPLDPFGTTSADVRSAVADVNGDGVDDSVLVTGPGDAVRFAVLDGRDNATYVVKPTDPFGNASFTLGAFVAAADIDGDGRAELAFTPDQGGGPNVVIFSVNLDGTLGTPKSFFALGNPAFRGGARVAMGDFNGDGRADIAVGAGFLGGPNVEIHDGMAVAGGDFTTLVLPGFFAFTGADATTLRNGVFLAAGDVNGDGFSDLVVGGGPGGGPRVLILDGRTLANKDIFGAYASPVANFFFGNGSDRGGVRVATVDADGDGKADVAVGSGENLRTVVRVYFGRSINNQGEPVAFQDLDPYGTVLSTGVFVG